jgi:hypothetical protein
MDEQKAFMHPGEPVPAVDRGEPCFLIVMAILAQVVDHHEAGAAVRIVEADLDRLVRGVLGRVDQCLLVYPGDGEPSPLLDCDIHCRRGAVV